jgi:heterotetrameric sarcosine oxidase gamma subunit
VQVAGQLSIYDGIALPQQPNSCTARGPTLAAWLAPRRWLLVGPRPLAERWLSHAAPGTAVVDLSHGRAMVRINGDWRAVLSRHCPLDLETALPPQRFSCAQSLFGDIPVLIVAPPGRHWVELFAPRSYGVSFRQLLADSVQHLGGITLPPTESPDTPWNYASDD